MATRQLEIQCALTELEVLRLAAREFFGECFDNSVDLNRLLLSLEEVAANIIEHGASLQAAAPIEFEFFKDERSVRIVISDRQPSFDPTQKTQPDLQEHAQAGKPRGLGIFLYTTLMHTEYKARSGGGNVLTLTRSLAES